MMSTVNALFDVCILYAAMWGVDVLLFGGDAPDTARVAMALGLLAAVRHYDARSGR